jgi:hypothetical protein
MVFIVDGESWAWSVKSCVILDLDSAEIDSRNSQGRFRGPSRVQYQAKAKAEDTYDGDSEHGEMRHAILMRAFHSLDPL